MEVPTSPWTADFDASNALAHAPRVQGIRPSWQRVSGLVAHTFTHFPLELFVYRATVGARTPAPSGTRWVVMDEIAGEALPSVMRKVLAHAE